MVKLLQTEIDRKSFDLIQSIAKETSWTLALGADYVTC